MLHHRAESELAQDNTCNLLSCQVIGTRLKFLSQGLVLDHPLLIYHKPRACALCMYPEEVRLVHWMNVTGISSLLKRKKKGKFFIISLT